MSSTVIVIVCWAPNAPSIVPNELKIISTMKIQTRAKKNKNKKQKTNETKLKNGFSFQLKFTLLRSFFISFPLNNLSFQNKTKKRKKKKIRRKKKHLIFWRTLRILIFHWAIFSFVIKVMRDARTSRELFAVRTK